MLISTLVLKEPEGGVMTRETAIRLIQRHERARQGRLRAKFMMEIRQQEEADEARKLNSKPLEPIEAAIRLQKVLFIAFFVNSF
ncbi:unnamed protein product [Protopolystoma xenopodis]|uniref:Uncharacterized protein n=1 Tax=Protopolystoma xenopodis TaxID=117903 RepID=A0A448X3V7_9PLAT|nr:unnamed protein product [Protopolystoma xenopodis]